MESNPLQVDNVEEGLKIEHTVDLKESSTNDDTGFEEGIYIESNDTLESISYAHNPWQTESVQDFWFVRCPECAFYTKNEESFQVRAVENHPASLELFGKTVKEEIIDDTFERSHFEFEDTNDNFADTYDDKLRKVKVKEEISEHIKEEEFENNKEKNKSLKKFQCPICLKWF